GPQGTLYGRNATAGVVNLIPAMPGPDFGGEIKGEVGNYKSKRLSGMLNLPVTDTLGMRLAGAWTKRDGLDYNTFHDNRVNNRARTGKQLCTNDPGPESMGGIEITNPLVRGKLSQGCLPGSLYDDAAYGMPNGYSLAYIFMLNNVDLGYMPNPDGGRELVSVI